MLEYREQGEWRPVRREHVHGFDGGSGDGIFALRLRGLPSAEFRVGVR